MKRFLLALVCLAVLAVETASAAEGGRFALVIGNAAYPGDAALANSANDANDMAAALSYIGWQVTKLIDGDRRAMNKTIAEFRDAIAGSQNATALLFYAGHGIQIGGNNYLIPTKGVFESVDDVVNDAISLQSILNAFDDAKVSTNIVILDACRDNPFVKKNTRALGGTRGLSVVSKSTNVEGSAVLFSTAPGDTAADGTGRNGVFTQALLKYITTDLSLQVLATRVTGEVRRITGGKQTPYSSLSLSDEFFMVPASMRSAAPPATEEAVPTLAFQPPVPIKDNSDTARASLIVQRETLTVEKRQIQQKGGWVGWLGGTGWVLAGSGAALAGYGYYAGGKALEEYNTSHTQKGWDAARDNMEGAGNWFNMGLMVGGVGIVTGVVSLFLGPDTSSVDKKIKDVEAKITLLGGN